jgi:hypothetical protein
MLFMFRVILASSKTFDNYDLLESKLDHLLQNQDDVELCLGFCLSSDEMGRKYAAARSHKTKDFPPGFKGIDKSVAYAHALAVFYDGKSSGIQKLIEAAVLRGIPRKIIRYDAPFEVPVKPMPPKLPRNAVVIDGEVLSQKTKERKRKAIPAGDSTWKVRYKAAHDANFAREYPCAFKDGHLVEPVYPKVRESNGLQTAVVNYLNWQGHRAKRINNMGRLVDGVEVTESGAKITAKKWLPSAAGKGQADVSATVWLGRSAQLEIKAGNDKPSAHQLKEQAKERKAGGIYEFIHSIEQFFTWYDKVEESAQNNYQQVDLFGG